MFSHTSPDPATPALPPPPPPAPPTRREPLLVRAVTATVRLWTRVYTARMRPLVRDTRRAEIESDLWESLDAARQDAAATRTSVARQMLARLFAGVPHDLLWRAEHRADCAPASPRLIATTVATLVLIAAGLWVLPVLQADQLPALPGPPRNVRRMPPPPPPPQPPLTPAQANLVATTCVPGSR